MGEGDRKPLVGKRQEYTRVTFRQALGKEPAGALQISGAFVKLSVLFKETGQGIEVRDPDRDDFHYRRSPAAICAGVL